MLRMPFFAYYLLMGSFLLPANFLLAQDDEDGEGIQFAPDDDSSGSGEQSDMFFSDEDQAPPSSPQDEDIVPSGDPIAPAPLKQNPVVNTDEPTETLNLSSGRRDILFGAYRIRIGLAKPEFEKLLYYDKLYGSEDVYPTIAADWFFWDWYATMGLSFRTGYYTAKGKAAKEIEKPLQDITAGDIEKDPNSRTNLTLLPLQIALTAEITPLRQKWLVIDGYIGFESLYFQEVRSSPNKSSAAVISPNKSDGDVALTNNGTKQLTVLGFSANILLNGLDGGASANSMRGTMGLANIYLSPFIEYSRALDRSPFTNKVTTKNPDFSRTTMGIGFTFESLK